MAIFQTFAGNYPSPNSRAYDPWVNTVIRESLDQCPIERTTTFYFASSANGGSDANPGTEASPKETIAEAKTQLDAWTPDSGGLALLFNRGDEWRESTGLVVDESNVTVAAYGTGRAPLWSFFTGDYLGASVTWSNASGDRWTATVTEPNVVREAGRKLLGYRRIPAGGTPLTTVEDNPYSWHYTGGVLHINAGASVDPNDVDFEYTPVTTNDTNGIEISAGSDNCRVDGIRLDGWGCYGGNTQNYGIKAITRDSDLFVASNVQCYYNDRHELGHNGGSGSNSGGSTVWLNVRFGYVLEDNGSHFVSFTGEGGQEVIVKGAICEYGWLANDATTRANGEAAIVHTDSGVGENPAFACIMGLHVNGKASMRAARLGKLHEDLADVTDVDDCIATFHGCSVSRGEATGDGQQFAKNSAFVNCYLEFQPEDGNPLALSATAGEAWVINTIIDTDLVDVTETDYGFWNDTASTRIGYFWNCWFHWRRNGVTDAGLDYRQRNGGQQSEIAGLEVVNCIFSADDGVSWNTDQISPWALNTATGIRNCAFFNIDDAGNDGGYDTAANTVELPNLPMFEVVGDDETLTQLQAGETSVVPFDFYGRVRSGTPMIGPFNGHRLQDARFVSSNVISQLNTVIGPVLTTRE